MWRLYSQLNLINDISYTLFESDGKIRFTKYGILPNEITKIMNPNILIISCFKIHSDICTIFLRLLRSMGFIFIRPFEKRDVLCRGNVRPSVCPSVRLSVRPSVRPRFPDFSSTCFEISIWNLVYAFSRWHDMSSLSCITIGSIWPSLQPKVGQTYFL